MVAKEPFDLTVAKKQFIVSHPTGNTFVHALICELHKYDLLSMFFTTIGSVNLQILYSENFLKEGAIPYQTLKFQDIGKQNSSTLH